MGSPAVHEATSLEDAYAMFDGHVPLTAREKRYILESLYDLAFREGARQGRMAGRESVYGEIKVKAAEVRGSRVSEIDDYVATTLETLVPESDR